MSDWKECVVSLIDMIGIRDLASGPKGAASTAMRKMHKTVAEEMRCGLPLHAYTYVWNDSVLLLAYLDKSHRPEAILREVDGLKRTLSRLGKSYAISIKGKAFPDLGMSPQTDCGSRITLVRASSFAMANCFRVEEIIGKKLKRPWYVDSRLAKKIHTTQSYDKEPLDFMPGPEPRDVYVYRGYLWGRDGSDVDSPIRRGTKTRPRSR